MSRLDDIMYRLRKDNEVPQQVWEKLDRTLENLPQPKKRLSRRWTWGKSAAAAACVLVAGTAFCAANPVLAERLPFIGRIFEEVEKDLQYFGEDAEKRPEFASVSEAAAEDTGSAADGKADGAADDTVSEKAAAVDIRMTAADEGITVTVSEAYSDGISVFLTLQVEAEQGGFLNIPGMQSGEGATGHMYVYGEWNLDGEPKQEIWNLFFEGKAIDSNTFIGMAKFDLPKQTTGEMAFHLELTRIGWDDVNDMMEEDISVSHMTEGTWEFALPITAAADAVQEIAIGKEQNGYTLEKVLVSPYQIVTCVDVPSKTVTLEEKQTGYTYEEYAECDVLVFDQDGNPLPYAAVEGGRGRDIFQTSGREITTLQICVCDDFDAFIEIKKGVYNGEGFQPELAKELALIYANIEL